MYLNRFGSFSVETYEIVKGNIAKSDIFRRREQVIIWHNNELGVIFLILEIFPLLQTFFKVDKTPIGDIRKKKNEFKVLKCESSISLSNNDTMNHKWEIKSKPIIS